MKNVSVVALGAIVALGVSCTSAPMSPTSPSAATEMGVSAANADGSTLKVSKPGLVTPFDSERIDSRRPTMIWQNSSGLNAPVGMAYELEVWNDTQVIYSMIVGETPSQGTHVYPTDLAYDTAYSWRIRAALENERGPWSDWGNFRTMVAPIVVSTPSGPVTGTIGPPRSIGFGEAYSIVKAVHDGGRFNLGSRSSRDYRVNFLFGAVAAIHYGHARYNPKGPDTNWCVKDAGGGRPPSDDVIVMCNTREAWDLIISAGGDGYQWHADYLGRLPNSQNVYPPGRSALNFIGQ